MFFSKQKVVDDLLLGGNRKAIDDFMPSVGNCFKLGHTARGPNLKFLGCRLCKSTPGSIEMGMSDYLNLIHTIDLTRRRRNEPARPADESGTHLYGSVVGTLL